jgi:hypothetical protein
MRAKSILFKMNLKGRGIVNFDSNDQKYYWNRQKDVTRVRHDNVSFGKGNYYTNEDGTLSKELKISASCLRHAIHIEGHPHHSINIMHSESTRLKFLAHIDTLVRGYLLPNTGERKKSVYTITDAVSNGKAVSSIETHARSGEKLKNLKEDDVADSSFFGRESVGETTYQAMGAIHLDEIMFISLSDLFDRRSVQDDSVEEYIEYLSNTLGSPVEVGYYVKKNGAYQIPERGILLNESQTKILLNHLVEKILCLSIGKSQTGYAMTESVEFKVVQNPLEDTFNSRFSELNLDDVSFESLYEKVDENEAIDLIEAISSSKTKNDSDRKEKKEAKKSKKTKPVEKEEVETA